jgi:hypothetical protein
MPSVPLNFLPPADPGAKALIIYEAAEAEGPFTQIERNDQIGTYPNYITRYTTEEAANVDDWFTIQWEYEAGTLSEMSQAVKGGTTTLVGEITERVLLRDSSLDENVVAQEAEAVANDVAPAAVLAEDVSVKVMSGMVMLTLARVALIGLLRSSSVSGLDFTAGIVSIKNSAATGKNNLETIEGIIRLANSYLGRSFSVILLVKEIETAGGYTQLVGADLSRTIVEFE